MTSSSLHSNTDDGAQLDASAYRSIITGVECLAAAWQLDDIQVDILLGVKPSKTWREELTSAVPLTSEQQLRISHLLNIYATLHSLFNSQLADEWLLRPNSNEIFSLRPPLDLMLSDEVEGMIQIRAYLEGSMHGWSWTAP